MNDVLVVGDIGADELAGLLDRFGLELVVQSPGDDIKGSFWGESEAGIVGRTIYVRSDTPVHSFLHETCHIVCMDGKRRERLDCDAGSDDTEESAVCYLQVLLGDHLAGVGRDRLMTDMDRWGYSFRLGNTRAWFERDAEDAIELLLKQGLIDEAGRPTFTLRA